LTGTLLNIHVGSTLLPLLVTNVLDLVPA